MTEVKLSRYCLDPKKKHSKEFFDVGYTPYDAKLLFKYIEEDYDIKERNGDRFGSDNAEQFSIPMSLGVTRKRMFFTCWQIDYKGVSPKLTLAYRNSRYDSQDHSDEEDEMQNDQ